MSCENCYCKECNENCKDDEEKKLVYWRTIVYLPCHFTDLKEQKKYADEWLATFYPFEVVEEDMVVIPYYDYDKTKPEFVSFIFPEIEDEN